MKKLTTLSDGSILATWDNVRGALDSAQYIRHRDAVWEVAESGQVTRAFGGLRMHPGEPLELAVRRGLAGERGAPRSTRKIFAGVVILALVVALFNLNHLG